MSRLIPAKDLQGINESDTQALRTYLEDARSYLLGFGWCTAIRDQLFGIGLGGVVAVFLMEVEIKGIGRERFWVVTGNPPSTYFAHARAATPCAALREYCRLADDWATAVRRGTSLRYLPLAAEPTLSAAEEVASKVLTLRAAILPALCPDYWSARTLVRTCR